MNNIWTLIELFTIYCFSKFDTNCECKSFIYFFRLTHQRIFPKLNAH